MVYNQVDPRGQPRLPYYAHCWIVAGRAFLCGRARCPDAVPYSTDQPGYHTVTVELARFCLQNSLFSQGKALRDEVLKEARAGSDENTAAKKLADEFDLTKPDIYTSKAWAITSTNARPSRKSAPKPPGRPWPVGR